MGADLNQRLGVADQGRLAKQGPGIGRQRTAHAEDAMPAMPGPPSAGGGYNTYSQEMPASVGAEALPPRETFGDRLSVYANQERPPAPESGENLRQRVASVETGLQLVAEAARQDSSSQWTVFDRDMQDIRREIMRIKAFIGLT